MNELRSYLVSPPDPQTIFVIPHLDVLTTTTRSSLSDVVRELIALISNNPRLQLLAFKDPNFEMVESLKSFFPAQRKIFGLRRDVLPQLITQNEARKFHDQHFDPYSLYMYVSGLNAIRLRQILKSLLNLSNADPLDDRNE